MSFPRIECRDCHHALRLQSNGTYQHGGQRAGSCSCVCEGRPLDGITYFIPKHMRKHIPEEMMPDAWRGAPPDTGGVPTGSAGDVASGYPAAAPVQPDPIGAVGDPRADEGAGPDVDGSDGGLDPSIRWFSNSELGCFRRCKRKWWFAFYRQLKLRYENPAGVRGLGTRLHLALAARYSMSSQNPMDVLIQSFDEDMAKLQLMAQDPACNIDVGAAMLELKKDQEYGEAMLEGYFEWLAESGADEGMMILAAEERVAVQLPQIPGVGLAGKLDVRILREQDRARLFMDHKSVGNFTEPAKVLHLDTQMFHYHLLEMLQLLERGASGEELEASRSDGGLYNMLRRVKRTAAANPPFYQRLEIRHNIHELRSYYMRTTGEIHEILTATAQLNSGVDHRTVCYPNPKRDCSWDCDFLPICPMADDGSRMEHAIETYYETHDVMERYRDSKEG